MDFPLPRRSARALLAMIASLLFCAYCRAEESYGLPVEAPQMQVAERPEIRPLELLPIIEPSQTFSTTPLERRADLSAIPLSAAPPLGSPAAPNPLKPPTPADDAARFGRTDPQLVSWVPPALSHKPVYFEEVGVERYGQTRSPALQPVISGAKFLAGAAILPYKMGVDSPRQTSYDVGFARPGTPTPGVREHLPLSLRGLLYQGAATTGAVFFIRP